MTTTSDLITSEMLAELTGQLWSAVVPEGPSLEESPTATALIGGTPALTGRVEIAGSWTGSVELSCSLAVARQVAAAMFSLPEPDLDELALRDAIGELVNIVGGNLKSLLPPPTSLSLPAVAEAAAREADEGAERSCEAGFAWLAEPVVVRVRAGS